MNFEENSPNTSSIIVDSKSLSGVDGGFKAKVPSFSHHPADLSKKTLSTKANVKTTKPDGNGSPEQSKTHSTSFSNFSFLVSARNQKYARPYQSKEVAPKVLNMSHDGDLPNPGAYTEGNSSVIGHNHSRNENRVATLPEDGEIIPSPISRRTRGNIENGPDSSRFYFFNQQNANQPPTNAQSVNITITQDNHRTQPIVIDHEAAAAAQGEQDKSVPNAEPAQSTQEMTAESAENWQHDLTVRANHKFRVVQWTLIFIILASLMAYASLSGETPLQVLYIVLLLNNLLQIYSLVRFFNRRMFNTKKGLNRILKLSDWIILTVYALGSLLKVQTGDMTLMLYLIPVPINIILRLAFVRKRTSILRIILWIQVIIFTLQIDEFINVSWYLVFGISLALSVAFIIRLFPMMHRIKQKKELSKELVEESHLRLIRIKTLGIGWNLLLNSFSLVFLLFFYGLAQELDSGETSHLLGATLIIAMVYSIVLIYLSLKYKYEITRSIITKIIKNDKDHIKIKEILQKELEVGISNKLAPRHLIKVSSTYYQVAESEMKTRPERTENKHKTTFVTVGDLAANGKDDNNDENAEEDEEEDEDEVEDNEEEEKDDQEEEKEDYDEHRMPDPMTRKKDSERGPTPKFSFRTKKAPPQPSRSEADESEEEEETPDDKIKSEENGQDDPHCFVCCDKLANAVIMECGHAGVCYQCGLEMWKKEEKCYMCRQKITKLLRLDKNVSETNKVNVQLATTLNKNHKININESFQDILNEI